MKYLITDKQRNSMFKDKIEEELNIAENELLYKKPVLEEGIKIDIVLLNTEFIKNMKK